MKEVIKIFILLNLLSLYYPSFAQKHEDEVMATIHTRLPKEHLFVIGMHSRYPFGIDWGDGIITPYESGNYGIDGIKGSVKGDGIIRIIGKNPTDILSLYLGNDNVSQKIDLLDISKLTGLKFLYCQNNNLEDINIDHCTRLMELNVAFNQLQKLSLDNTPNIDMLICHHNQLKLLDLKSIKRLTALRCEHNNISELKVSSFPELTVLRCDANPLSSLDISKNTKLQQIYASATNIKFWDFTPHEDLRVIDLSGIENVTISWGKKKELRSLYLNSCKLQSFESPKMDNLDRLELQNNSLIDINLKNMPLLKDLRISNNQFSSLDLSAVPLLRYLFAEKNQISEIDLSISANLYELLLSENKISSIDLSRCSSLYLLWLSNNPLSYLDITKNKKLNSIFLDHCKFSENLIESITELMPDVKNISVNENNSWWKKWFLIKDNPFSQVPDVSLAIKKGWKTDITDKWPGKLGSDILSIEDFQIVRCKERIEITGKIEGIQKIRLSLYTVRGEHIVTIHSIGGLQDFRLPDTKEHFICFCSVNDQEIRSIL